MVRFGLTFWLLKKKQDWGFNVSSIKKRVVQSESVKLRNNCATWELNFSKSPDNLPSIFQNVNLMAMAIFTQALSCNKLCIYMYVLYMWTTFHVLLNLFNRLSLSLQSWYSGWGPQSTSWTVSEVRGMQSRSSCIWNLHFVKSSLGNQKLQYTILQVIKSWRLGRPWNKANVVRMS